MSQSASVNMCVMQIASRIWINNNNLLRDIEEDMDDKENYETLTYCPSPTSLEVIRILGGCEITCKKHLRLDLRSFRTFVQKVDVKRHGWSVEIEGIVFLFWLAAGCSYRVVSMSINVPRSTAFEIIKKVLDKTLELIPITIKYPNENELEEIGAGFAQKGKSNIFKKTAGAIDGTYVNILCPPHLHDEYINRKLRYAIQLQVLCDHNRKLLNIFTGYPGSVHDQRVFRNSSLYLNKEYPPPGYFMLGDSGYKCATTPVVIVTPYKGNNLRREQTIFNRHHSLARSVVERCIGELKNRWRYLFADRPIELKIQKAVKVIAACCVLHNICISNGEHLEDVEESVLVSSSNSDVDEASGIQFRDILCNELVNELSLG